jgi:hypothetical protein
VGIARRTSPRRRLCERELSRCATCGSREDLVVAGSIAFCETCLESSVREDENDLYRDTGGGD